MIAKAVFHLTNLQEKRSYGIVFALVIEVSRDEFYRENTVRRLQSALCFATCVPVISTVYAYEAQPGWHGEGG